MAVFTIQLFKSLSTIPRPWSNVYHVRATSLAEAVTTVPTIAAAEQAIHLELVTLTYARVSTTAEGDNVFQTVPLGLGCTRDATGEGLPLWNVVRVLFGTAAAGRPDSKFYRVPLTSDLVDGTLLSEATANSIADILIGVVAALSSDDTPLVSQTDDAWLEVVVQQAVQMRQMHRRRRRRPFVP